MYIPENEKILTEVISAYIFPETLMGAVRYGSGHINDTFCVVCQPQEGKAIRFILQGLSVAAFPRQEELMENFIGVTNHLRKKIAAAGGDVMRETLNLVPTRDGKPYYTDSTGKVWRLTNYVEGTLCLQKATPELFEASARAFGRFQRLLADYPAETLHEPIANFHNTEDRFAKFLAALEADKLGRAKEVEAEIGFAMTRKADCSVAVQALREGKLPLRVTHNDTKLNNVLMDENTLEGICVIDLDTTMPGLSIYDFGDSIRFGANHSAEDEKDLSKVNFDIELYRRYTRGFLEGASGGLTEAELEYLPWGAKLMTLECGIRFLTDYLDGDNYFHIHYPEQNLDRCRTQFKLVADMEAQWEQMHAIVKELAK
ncbi:MAG: aminoglycoside phosphotransferase family protein [Oscillospiraceae bacterium]|nr:aminoglycoside phosphotransferase family protein [Oscillospiraceae bacterium]